MSTPVPTALESTASIRPSPLVERVFGEPRFCTDGDVAAVCFAPDGTIRSVDELGVLHHWAEDGKLHGRHFLSDIETLWSFSPNAEWLASGNDDLLLWEAETGQLVQRIDQPSWVTAIAFSADGRTVASGHDDGTVRFWDVASQKSLGLIKAHPKAVSAISFAPRGEFVATAGEDRVVRVWDEFTHKVVAEMRSHTDRIPALSWNPDGSLLVSAGWDTSARVWRPPQSDPVMLLNSHADQVHTLAFSPDGKYLACADSDFEIYLWKNVETAEVGKVLTGHVDEIRCLAFSPDGSKLLSAGADRVLHLWDVATGKLLAGPSPHNRNAIAISSGPSPRLASTAGMNVRVWDVATGEEIAPTGLCPAHALSASPDGRLLAIGGTDHLTRLWDLVENRLARALEATKPPIGDLAFAPGTNLLAQTSPSDGLVWLWQPDASEASLILIEAADGCTLETVAAHPNGSWIACGGIDYLSTGERDGAVCVWDATTKEKLFTLDTGVNSLAFDPAGRYLAGAGVDESIYLWEVETRENIFTLPGHQQRVNAVAFDPTGSYLVSGGDDMTVRVWDVLSGRLMVSREFDSAVQSLAFSPDGKYLFTGNGNTTCYQIEFKRILGE